ncbi:MAG: type 1 glutamine amidotransferase [Sphingomonas sp.]
MKLAILETGKPPADLIPAFGRYPAMFEKLLGPDFAYTSIDLSNEPLPPDVTRFDAYLVTGSSAGVYDDHHWIAPLKTFVQAAAGPAKLVGICFGHQIMAEALGGKVEKSAKGWGVGLQTYPIVRREEWMDDAPAVSVPASHQDQVVLQPPGTEIVASSVFTPYAGLVWRDRPAVSFQFHPEIEPDYAAALYDSRRDRLPDADAAIASLAAPNDNDRVGDWIRRFLLG